MSSSTSTAAMPNSGEAKLRDGSSSTWLSPGVLVAGAVVGTCVTAALFVSWRKKADKTSTIERAKKQEAPLEGPESKVDVTLSVRPTKEPPQKDESVETATSTEAADGWAEDELQLEQEAVTVEDEPQLRTGDQEVVQEAVEQEVQELHDESPVDEATMPQDAIVDSSQGPPQEPDGETVTDERSEPVTPTEEKSTPDAAADSVASPPILSPSVHTTGGRNRSGPTLSVPEETATSASTAPPQPAVERKCRNCGVQESSSVFMYRCRGCRKILYCGRQCQTAHWRREHHLLCSQMKSDPSLAIVMSSPMANESNLALVLPDETENDEDGEDAVPQLSQQAKRERIRRTQTLTDMHKQFVDSLKRGQIFKKYTRVGSAHDRFVFVSDAAQVYWCVPGTRTENQKACVDLNDVTDVVVGKHTKVFQKDAARREAADCCFSLVTENRTLDLVAKDAGLRDTWVGALRYLKRKLSESK